MGLFSPLAEDALKSLLGEAPPIWPEIALKFHLPIGLHYVRFEHADPRSLNFIQGGDCSVSETDFDFTEL